jgi:hypothetical protein
MVGKSLECNLNWLIPDHQRDVYERYVGALTEAAIVSDVKIVYLSQDEIKARLLSAQKIDTTVASSELQQLAVDLEKQLANEEDAKLAIWDVEAVPAPGTKCNRCWRYTHDTANYGAWQDVCARCRGALGEMGIEPPQAEDAA